MKDTATIVPNEFTVIHTVSTEVGREFIKFDISGWDEVKKLTKKILIYGGQKYAYSCWNSDHNYCVFSKPLGREIQTAKFQ